MAADDTDDAHRMAQRPLGRDRGADARAQADRHIDHVQRRHGAEELPPAGGNAAHQVGAEARHHQCALLLRQRRGMFAAGLEVVAVFDQLGAQRAHRGVLLDRVAMRHHDRAAHAVGACRPGHALPVVAAGGADDRARAARRARARLRRRSVRRGS